ncbi:hypothetical protein BGW36DRAFT_389120 [Talaromyces proteolyticus]|uniref:Tat pathway signal sequence n=1 Tax=Talaromyces proteolyticus TaxID=1131652 RepID=A0AAD4PUY1_9EURO|nr:uncharacterized protein BGW36DRAFT_389120 [Talaromyces proteolyticus]KAH8690654.1 hypothetical protein BGW36DRAFT_389120 [Talaromyces proteolyticus]
MPANPQHQYSLIPKEAASQDGDDNRNSIENSSSIYDSPLVRKSSALGKRTTLVVIQIGILVVYTVLLVVVGIFFFPGVFHNLRNPYNLKYNAIQDAYRYQVREVDYNFNSTNPFKGAPIADIEEEWTRLMNGAHTLRVQEADMKKMNMSSIQMSDGSGDYLAVPISYHMLHCLYNIYRYNHPEFYGEDKGGPDWIVKHTDHCIDNLRHFVQCHVGTGFETWKWLETRKLPWPVVSTEEICVDWTYFDSRVRAQSIPAVDMKTMRNGKLVSHPKYGPVYEEDYYNHTLAA